MGLTSDANDPGLRKVGADGMQEKYLVLSDEERAKGFVRPVRTSYRHLLVPGPGQGLRDLTDEEHERYDQYGYVKFEPSSDPDSAVIGRYWTQAQLDAAGPCGATTTMAQALAETYARDPKFYSGTFCARCGTHFPVAQFRWVEADGSLGPQVGT